jgi:hypothetical protein
VSLGLGCGGEIDAGLNPSGTVGVEAPRMDDPRRIGPHELQLADVIFVTSDSAVGQFIRTVTGAEVSHTFLALGDGNVVEATFDSVEKRPLSLALHGTTIAIAMRRPDLGEAQRAAIREHALGFVGRPYDFVGVNAAGVHSSPAMAVGVCLNVPLACVAFEINATPEHRDRRLFCSELVCRTYELAGVPLVDRSPSFVNPAEVYRSPRLRYVGHLPVGAAAGS